MKIVFGIGATLLLFWLVPPFHVVPLQSARKQSAATAFDTSAFVEKFWNERLVKSADRAIDMRTLFTESQKDPKTARQKYGRTLGLSSTCYFFVSGTGRVVAVKSDSIALAVRDAGSGTDVILETGNIFGNTVRDATGLLNVNDFPNSRDFNDISSEINRRIEERVLPSLRAKVNVGATIRFLGCADINDDANLHPLHLIPLIAEVH